MRSPAEGKKQRFDLGRSFLFPLEEINFCRTSTLAQEVPGLLAGHRR
jgi:hypothetical protein